ncbi:hypothetical protein D3C74_186090 [compost metagenome]
MDCIINLEAASANSLMGCRMVDKLSSSETVGMDAAVEKMVRGAATDRQMGEREASRKTVGLSGCGDAFHF